MRIINKNHNNLFTQIYNFGDLLLHRVIFCLYELLRLNLQEFFIVFFRQSHGC